MSKAERNYSQIDKEALAIVAGVKRFHEYVYGRKFTIITDHKPLLGLIAGDKPTPTHMSPRMTRWAIFLAGYDYTLIHRPGASISNADGLSRCPVPEPVADPAPSLGLFHIDEDRMSPISSTTVATLTTQDKTLKKVLSWTLRGWPTERPGEEFTPFCRRQQELSVMCGCLLWGERVVIPAALQHKTLQTLHNGHPGVVRMKALARSYVWWPSLDRDIEAWVARCDPCQETRPAPPRAQPTEWEQPCSPWSRIHVDFAGPMNGKSLLIVVDAFSKWLEVVAMPSTTSEATTKALRRLFATHGLPDVLVSDNGPQLTSKQMEEFLATLGIRHALIAPYRPAGNGQAEKMVRMTKDALTRMGPGNWQEHIDQFLLTQHITPHTTTKKSPAELLMGRKLRSPLDRLHPLYNPRGRQTDAHPPRSFAEGDLVFAMNFRGPPKWLKGQVVRVTGPRSYEVQLDDGQLTKRHIDQLRKRWRGVGENQPDEVGLQHPGEVDLPFPGEEGLQHPDEADVQHPDEVGLPRPDEVGLPHPSRVDLHHPGKGDHQGYQGPQTGNSVRGNIRTPPQDNPQPIIKNRPERQPCEVGHSGYQEPETSVSVRGNVRTSPLDTPQPIIKNRPEHQPCGVGQRHPGEGDQRHNEQARADTARRGSTRTQAWEPPRDDSEYDLEQQPDKVGLPYPDRGGQRRPNRDDPGTPVRGSTRTRPWRTTQPNGGSNSERHPGRGGQPPPDQVGRAHLPSTIGANGEDRASQPHAQGTDLPPGGSRGDTSTKGRPSRPEPGEPLTGTGNAPQGPCYLPDIRCPVQRRGDQREWSAVQPSRNGEPPNRSPDEAASAGGARRGPAHSTAAASVPASGTPRRAEIRPASGRDHEHFELRRSGRTSHRPAYLRDYVTHVDCVE